MIQEKINLNVDSLYKWQIDETGHQNHRLAWILAAQTIIITALCTVLCAENLKECVIVVLLLVGILISVSGIYSVLISQTAIGTVFERWHHYDSLPLKLKKLPIPHVISLVPTHFLKSGFRWLMFYSFAPNVFCAAWVTLSLTYVNFFACWNYPNVRIIYAVSFLIILTIVVIISHVLGNLFLYKWVYDEFSKKADKNNNLNQNAGSDLENTNKMNIYRNVGNNSNGIILNSFNDYSSNSCQNERCLRCSGGRSVCENKIAKSNTWANLRIYHIMIDRFNGGWLTPPQNSNQFLGGNVKGIIDKLDWIKMLGYNTIMLTPIFKTEAYHGYHITNYEEVDKHFGDWADFDNLITIAHQKGIKVICDYVPNHCHINHPFFQAAQNDINSSYRSWFYFNQGRKGGFVSYQNIPDLPKFNLYDEGAATYHISIAVMLAKKGVDGLRIDHVIGVPFSFLKELRYKVKEINPELFLFGEAWFNPMSDLSQVEFINMAQKTKAYKMEVSQEEIQLNYVDYLDGLLDFKFRELILEEIENLKRQKQKFNILGNVNLKNKINNHFNKYPKGFQLILFLDNHDTNRFLFHCDGNTLVLQEGLSLCKNIFSLPYSIYYGTEQFMKNMTDIFNGNPHADLDVREPLPWN